MEHISIPNTYRHLYLYVYFTIEAEPSAAPSEGLVFHMVLNIAAAGLLSQVIYCMVNHCLRLRLEEMAIADYTMETKNQCIVNQHH